MRATTTKTEARCRADAATIRKALGLLEEKMRYELPPLSSPQAARDYARLRLERLEHEVFMAIWLDAGSCLIEAEEMFRGTLTQTSVYPREVVKSALRVNAAAVILAHNHPSGRPRSSMADRALTATLKQALGLVDVSVIDHIIVAPRGLPYSMALAGEL